MLKPNETFSKMQTDNYNLNKNVTTIEKYILRKMGRRVYKIAFYVYLVTTFVTLLELRGHEGPMRPFK